MMTREEKFKAINERLVQSGLDELSEVDMSIRVVLGYTLEMRKGGFFSFDKIELDSKKKTELNILQEFEWQPSDLEIEMIMKMFFFDAPKKYRYLFKHYRDNPEETLAKCMKMQTSN